MIDYLGHAAVAVQRHKADQRATELAALGALAHGYGCRSVLEIGTFRGGSAWYFAELPGVETVTTIDRDMSQLLTIHPAVGYMEVDSATVSYGQGADLLFIDGDHRLEGVTRDFAKFAPCAQKLVAIHDITPHPPEMACEVDQLWRSIAVHEATVEIVDDSDGIQWAGIGVMFVGRP